MAHYLACPRIKLAKLIKSGTVGPRFYEKNLEHNQQVNLCCRHIDNHDIEAWYSCETDRDRGVPDIYIIYCNGCGRRHFRFCVGGSVGSGGVVERRPYWEVR